MIYLHYISPQIKQNLFAWIRVFRGAQSCAIRKLISNLWESEDMLFAACHRLFEPFQGFWDVHHREECDIISSFPVWFEVTLEQLKLFEICQI